MNNFLSVTTFKRLGLGIVFLWFFVGGVGHFTNAGFFVAIAPPWVPFPVCAVYISGVIEIVLAPQSPYLIRLVVQVLLLLLIWWSTRSAPPPKKSSDIDV